jgi:hypothetical protein
VLPIVWVYIVLVISGWALLLYLETKRRAQRHVKGCPSLPYISPERLDSLILIESDLILVQLSSKANSGDTQRIPDALQVPIDQLEHFLSRASPRSVFVFYDSLADPVDWGRVEAILCRHPIHYLYVLKGGLEAWLSRHGAHGIVVAS